MTLFPNKFIKFMMRFPVKLIFILLTFSFTSVFGIRSYQMIDTKPIKRNFNSKNHKKGEKYFPINWYESYYPELSHYEKTNWKPYSPSFKQPFHSLKNRDAYHRIKKLIDDNVATGVILYMKNNKVAFSIVDSLAKKMDIEIYPQIYNKHLGKNIPPEMLENYKFATLENDNVNIYFNDDVLPEIWSFENTKRYAEILHESFNSKYLMSCCAMINYLKNTKYINDEADIIAPQLYPLINKGNIKKDLYEIIPKDYHFHQFYQQLITLKQHTINYNKRNEHQIYEFVTLANFHLNRKNWSHISRFPSYEEFRYEFFTSVICGAKGVNIFSNFACNEESYNSVKKVIEEFRGVEDSILHGVYSPKEIQIEGNLFGNNIDFACYVINQNKFVIISNTSWKMQDITLKNIDAKNMMIYDFDTKKTKNEVSKLDLLLKPFEIKILKIRSLNK